MITENKYYKKVSYMNNIDYKVKKGKILTEKGLPFAPRWFCDGRMAIEIDNKGISQLDYFGPELSGNYRVFKKRFWDGICFYFNQGGKRTALKPKKCEIMPFGFKSKSENFEYSIYTVNDCLFVIAKPEFDCNLDVEFYDDSVFRPETHEHKGIGLGGGAVTVIPYDAFADKNIIKVIRG